MGEAILGRCEQGSHAWAQIHIGKLFRSFFTTFTLRDRVEAGGRCIPMFVHPWGLSPKCISSVHRSSNHWYSWSRRTLTRIIYHRSALGRPTKEALVSVWSLLIVHFASSMLTSMHIKPMLKQGMKTLGPSRPKCSSIYQSYRRKDKSLSPSPSLITSTTACMSRVCSHSLH